MNRSIKTNRNFLKVFCLHCFRIFVVLAQFFGPFFGQFSLQFFRTWWWLPPGIFVILVSLAQVCVASFSFLFFLALQIRFLVPCESVNDPVFFFFFFKPLSLTSIFLIILQPIGDILGSVPILVRILACLQFGHFLQ